MYWELPCSIVTIVMLQQILSDLYSVSIVMYMLTHSCFCWWTGSEEFTDSCVCIDKQTCTVTNYLDFDMNYCNYISFSIGHIADQGKAIFLILEA